MTRLETNFKRLLNRCETIASSNDELDWRLEKVNANIHRTRSLIDRNPNQPIMNDDPYVNNYKP